MSQLDGYRDRIDEIDEGIARLFEARMDVVRDVAQYKMESGMAVLQPDREHAVLDRAEQRARNPAYAPALRQLYETVMALSRAMQHEMLFEAGRKVAPPAAQRQAGAARASYPGAPGSFSEQAARGYFGSGAALKAYATFEEAARAAQRREVDCAVLPIENSTAGSVEETYRVLELCGLTIVGEQLVEVRHHLLGVRGAVLSGVREVRSHPQAIAQCHTFLSGRALSIVPSDNTALSAREVARGGDAGVAAIASLEAAEQYGLSVLAPDIHDVKGNTTRFVIASPVASPDAAADKASLVFTLQNRVGALSRVIGAFARQDINLSRLESRPMPETPWTYRFFADLEWQKDRRALELALEEAGRDADSLKLLGLYRKAERV